MANCYRCGRPIEDTKHHLRRKVRTGGYERRRFGRGKVDVIQSHYGMRVVCAKCARFIDLHEGKVRLADDMRIVAWLLAMVVLVLLLRS